ncbi:N-acetyltransferase [Parabacteroides sp. 52]|uniref:GNAT family N-acetyltransferase n=1 Tax=unclassified Parabacteroides TaxID=2649774 RepID=UPI0013D3214A|nr:MULTISPECIES: GNAT family N-acetyltransferase [unclassified Parabacteroides]MDH6533884.1 diamine N-acetyltransferase [Parabacteroides sp. PM5-20]NDV54629.1 N-acetyltransferase [Parabacteroides sp. 52]
MEYLKNEHIYLRALEPTDLDLLYAWENDSALWHVGGSLTPYSRYSLKEYILESHRDIYDLKQLRLVIVERRTEKAIGLIDLYDFDPHHRRAGTGILLDVQSQGKGWATEALMLLIEYAFSFLKMHQLYAYIPEKNIPSKTLFQRCGFQLSGTLKDWITAEEGYQNVCVMQLLHKQ